MSTAGKPVLRKKPSPVEYPSHSPVKLNKNSIKKTENGGARFKWGLDPLEHAKLYVSAAQIPPDIDPDDALNYWKKLNYVVGASDGKTTEYIIIKRYCCTVHARPVTAEELRQNFKVKKI
jgi:hypothetical protein